MDINEAVERVKVAFENVPSNDNDAWEELAGERGENYESFVLSLIGIEPNIAFYVEMFEEIASRYKDDPIEDVE